MSRRTVEEWEAELGRQVRDLRLDAELTQVDLAGRANVSVPTLRNLEAGRGSSLKTVIAVARALGRQDWLEGLAADEVELVDPLEVFEQAQVVGRQRASRSR